MPSSSKHYLCLHHHHLSLLLLVLFLSRSIIGAEIRLINKYYFSLFVESVNSGVKFNGTTVLLDSDLSLAGISLEVIGKDAIDHFASVFDGQGHVISDLNIESFSNYTGLFGYSTGLTIRNVVLDSSCSITNSYNDSSNFYVGGFIGYCQSKNDECKIENSVNMADVVFNGDNNDHKLHLGGLAGYFSSSEYESTMKNCANYGSITHLGDSGLSYIGGILGIAASSKRKYFRNCLNHGIITSSGTSSYLYLGGIMGLSQSTYIENCVCAGKISAFTSTSSKYFGNILGYVNSDTYINYLYYSDNVGGSNKYGYKAPADESYVFNYNSTTFELNGIASIGNYTGASLIDSLNAYSDYCILRDYPKWLLNKGNNIVKFTINKRVKPIAIDSQVILLPSLTTGRKLLFDGWYSDGKCTNLLESFEVTEDTEFYARFEENTNIYTIAFDTRREGVNIKPITARFGTVVSLPNDFSRDNCTIAFWENECGENVGPSLTVVARNITLYAVWECTHINVPEDFKDFSRLVNSGTNYSGTTVYLGSDLTFSEITGPIGEEENNHFHGVFDGQGYIISGLRTNSSSQYTGLFGYSTGLTIRNVVLDSSCTISSYSTSNAVYIGGIVGLCNTATEQCNIENSVNMADVAFGEYTKNSLYIGGIAGDLCSSSFVKNCANYGPVTHAGSSYYSYIGGIVGTLLGTYFKYIQNSLNYGTIIHKGTTRSVLSLGGIVGYSYYTHIENCVCAGKISTQNTPLNSYIGAAVGEVDFYTSINYYYYASDIGASSLYGYSFASPSVSNALSYDSTAFELDSTISVGSYTGSSLIDALCNAAGYYALRDYTYWLLNKDSKIVAFTINNRINPITMTYQVMLLPNLANEGGAIFDGWYKDYEYINPLESFEVTKSTKLHGRSKENSNEYTLSFDTRKDGVSVAPFTVQFGAVVELPSVLTKDYCSLSWWENAYGDNVGPSLIMPAHNFTLYAVWKCTHIKGPGDFIDFAKVVNSGVDDFSRTTVFLDTDLPLFEAIKPIGSSAYNQFLGVFDGQGYTISGAIVSSYSQYVGLFGYSKGLVIRNLVLDSSCTVTYPHNGSKHVYMGGLVGYCQSISGQCNIKNSVNMADITFSGNIDNYLYLGGFAGSISSPNNILYIENCANYGSVTHSGTSKNSFIGGVAGTHLSSNYKYIWNSPNYGAITHSGTTIKMLCIGGIAGYSYFAYIENCVSAGKISTQNTPSTSHIGSIVGYIKSDTNINNCYYTGDVGPNSTYGFGKPTYEKNTPNSSTVVNSTLISKLNNEISTGSGWSRWLLNANNAYVTFKISDNRGLSLLSSVIVLPSLADGWRNFAGWYTSSSFGIEFISSSVPGNTALYGRWDKYIVAFDANGGTVSEISRVVTYNSTYGELPTPMMIGHTFNGWFASKIGGSEVTSSTTLTNPSDHTLYAQWTICSYTLTFVLGNGNDDVVKVLLFDTAVEYPEEPMRKGYKFVGWDKNITSVPAEDTTIKAKWERKPSKTKLSITVGVPVSIAFVLAIFAVISLLVLLRARRYRSKNGDKYVLIDDDANGMQAELSNYASDEDYCRSIVNIIDETETKVLIDDGQSVLVNLYPQNYVRPSIRDALLAAGLTEDHTNLVCSACNIASQRVLKEGKLFDGLTLDDAAAIAMYTYDFGPKDFEHNPYRIINRSLAERNYSNLQRASGLLYLVMTALRKLPRVTGVTLYRGVRGGLNLDNEHYTSGNIVTWSALSSTSPSMDATKRFLAKESEENDIKGTLFIIDGGWGYSIQPYSLFPDEVEILLEPERFFKVTGVIEADLTIINLQMLNTPLSIPDVFGDGKRKN